MTATSMARGMPWRRRRSGREVRAVATPPGPLITLGRRLAGERALPVARGMVVLEPEMLSRHLIVCGASGSGKTETLLRLAWQVARATDASVFYLDGKADRVTAERFCGLMTDAGRETRVFPIEPLDAWRGQPHEIHGRLMEVIDYADSGGASWYRDIAKTALRLACEHPQEPPRSSGELLARLDLTRLREAHPGSGPLGALTSEQIRQVRLRYEAFFGTTRGALDGDWSFEDTKAAYLLLDSLTLREETAGLARLIFEDFSHHFSARKPREHPCVLIADEISSLIGAAGTGLDLASRVEQARAFNTGLVLAPQTLAGLGEESQSARIIGSTETIICHRTTDPEPIVRLAGTRQATEYTTQIAAGGASGAGSARVQHQFKVDPDQIRSLRTGTAYAIRRGRAMRLQVQRAPELSMALPEPERPIAPEAAPRCRAASIQALPF